MNYAVLCVLFVGVAAAFAFAVRRRAPRRHAAALGIAALVLVVLTAVFDTVMIASGLFDYADGLISGVRVGLAPIEDFAYPIGVLLVVTAVWNLLGGRRERTTADRAPEPVARAADDGSAPSRTEPGR